MRKKLCALGVILLLLASGMTGASAEIAPPVDLPYESYTYSLEGTALVTPAPYTAIQTVSATEMGLTDFKDLSDIFFAGERLYLCDSGNNRVVITDTEMKLLSVIQTFNYEGKEQSFKSPTGIFVNEESIYVADSLNGRIVIFDRDTLKAVRILDRPVISLLPENYTYTPVKITVDAAGRLYVVADGINRGLIELDENGVFSTFLGAPAVTPDIFGLIWRKFATKEQLSRLDKFVPTEYDAVYMDGNGFIYAVCKNSEGSPFVKLNAQGTDVLQFYDGFGDEDYKDAAGTSSSPYFADVAVSKQGFYFLLDSQQGKIYVYTSDGEFLYAFGSNSSQQGSFYTASAMELVNGRLYVLDSSKGTVTIFETSEFGKTVENAVYANAEGEYDRSRGLWQSVLLQCSHYPMAIIGLAQLDIQTSDYNGAMRQLKAIHELKYYAMAFEKWRDSLLRNQLAFVFLAIVLMAAVVVLIPRLVKRTAAARKAAGSPLYKAYSYGTYTMFHPFDGFWDIKRERKGNLSAALVILTLFTLCYGIRAQFSGYLITGTTSDRINSIYECLMILLPLVFWVVANWCFTTLMDGEGSMKDIVIFTCYALKPYIIFSVPLLILSHVLTVDEMVFYQVLNSVCLLWILALLFIGMMTTHDYSLSKAFLALLCTLIGICLIIFIGLLFINIIQDVVRFFSDIYTELSFRSY